METEVIAKKGNRSITSLIEDVEEKIVVIRNQQVIADADVAVLYGVQTKDINRAVRNNPDKFPPHYMFELTISELRDMRLKILTTNVSSNSHSPTKVFTERGLYMLATILKGERARAVTFAIIETFAQIRELKRELLEMHQETDKDKQKAMMQHFGEVLTDLVMPDLQTSETESSLEINFFIGKLNHTVKRVRKED